MTETRIGLVGAGFIAATHVDAIGSLKGLKVTAVIDPNLRAAERLAAQAQGARAFASLAEAVAAQAVDRVHVMVPPHLHAAVGGEALNAGLPTLLEKPLGVTLAEANALVALAAGKGVALGVNQNFALHPALARFARDLKAGLYGRLRHVSLVCAVPLRQLTARQFGHWMFASPRNILLEQMVHPLSQIAHLLEGVAVTAAVARSAEELAPGVSFHRAFDVSLRAGPATAQLHMAFGENFPLWHLTAVCDDGAVIVDCFRNTVARVGRTRLLEAADTAVSEVGVGLGLIGQSLGGFAGYLGAQLKLVGRQDAFFQSMRASIESFHTAVSARQVPPLSGAFGASVVGLAEEVAIKAGVAETAAPVPANLLAADAEVPAYDVAVFGGTGFIGRHVVEQLVAAGYSVGVAARNIRGLPEIFSHERVTLVRADVTRGDDIARAIGSAKYVVNLAHGGASGSREAIVAAMVGSAEDVAEACLAKGVKRLVHVSSIAALWLGDPTETITPATQPDPNGAERGDYAFAKAEAERRLLKLYREKGVPVTIQRPGVVVGEGGVPFHSALGLFNNDQHCQGWNDGRNGLAFVLVEDCASAIVKALQAGDAVLGRTDNIVGGVYMSAREYLEELRLVLGRPLKFHPQPIWLQQSGEVLKWAIKRAGGRAVDFPTTRDIRSRGMPCKWDISETERVLDWRPNYDPARFIERGIRVPARAMLD